MGGTVIETESERLIRKGREAGEIRGREEGIEGVVALCKRFGIPFADAVAQAASSFSLTMEDAESRVKKYW